MLKVRRVCISLHLVKWTLTLLMSLGAAVLLRAESSYVEDFAKLKREVPEAQREAHLAEWRKREPDNPDAWILSANWAFEQAQSGVVISTKPAGKDDLVVADPKTRKAVGSVSTGGIDTAKARHAVALLGEAAQRFPARLDIHCGRAHLLQEIGDGKAQLAALQAMAKVVKARSADLRWCHGETLDQPVEEFVADKLHSFAMFHYRQETTAGDARFRDIAKLASETCPGQAKPWNDLAISASLKKDLKGVQRYLEKAAEVAPSDGLVLLNLGENSAKLGLTKKARECYERVIALNANAEQVAHAKAALAALERK